MAGFEGADHRNAAGYDHDPQRTNGHLQQACDDYRRLARLGIRTVRESLGWRLTERASGFDFSRMRALQSAAHKNGVQILWSLMHYGAPDGVDCFDEHFVERFCEFVEAAGREFHRISDDVPVWTPINEINFLSWALTSTDLLWPHHGDRTHDGYLLKRRLARATLRAIDVLRAVDPRARFMHVEPVIHIVAPDDRPDLEEQAALEQSWQWQAWDMLCGRLEPDLGGSPEALDLLGVSHYFSSQWEHGTGQRLHWHLRDPRRLPMARLLGDVHRRYGRPVLVAETGHVGVGRGTWLDEMAGDVYRERRRGVPVIGYCLYPAVDRPDWERPDQWNECGLWDAPLLPDGRRGRRINRPSLRALRAWQRWLPERTGPEKKMRTLIVFSHLRWNFVYQRPQQVLTRLAGAFRVLFVEEPLRGNATPFLERYSPARNVEVLRPRTTVDAPGFADEQFPELKDLLVEYLDDFSIDDYVVWFYTPMALPMLDVLRPEAVVYDCMDELSAFRNAPPGMLEREAELLDRADVVFAGGPSLYEAKRRRHRNVLCLPSAVDADHYRAAANRPDREVDELMSEVRWPRLGFFGVIDERFDVALLDAVAASRPDWQFVMIGPVVKIDSRHLPKRPNIHWLGQQPYEKLPRFAASWDVCLLPFALNESTRFISPTKTLEYMAAERPVVSTPIGDVVALYGDAIEIAGSVEDFVDACSRLLAELPAERAQRLARMRAHVSRTTWDATAQAMLKQIRATLARQAVSPKVRARTVSVDRPRSAGGRDTSSAATTRAPVAAAASAGTEHGR